MQQILQLSVNIADDDHKPVLVFVRIHSAHVRFSRKQHGRAANNAHRICHGKLILPVSHILHHRVQRVRRERREVLLFELLRSSRRERRCRRRRRRLVLFFFFFFFLFLLFLLLPPFRVSLSQLLQQLRSPIDSLLVVIFQLFEKRRAFLFPLRRDRFERVRRFFQDRRRSVSDLLLLLLLLAKAAVAAAAKPRGNHRRQHQLLRGGVPSLKAAFPLCDALGWKRAGKYSRRIILKARRRRSLSLFVVVVSAQVARSARASTLSARAQD